MRHDRPQEGEDEMSCDACKRIPVLTGVPCGYCGRLNVEAEHFAAVRRNEREECAKEAERFACEPPCGHGECRTKLGIAAAIRARSAK